MIDTNILLSALVFNSSKMATLIEYVAREHILVLCSYIVDEAYDVITRKSTKYTPALDVFLSKMPFEMAYSPTWQPTMPDIRDKKDRPILASAITADVDILITGDNDFSEVEIERPEILRPSEFIEQYM